jgi:ribonuclease D
MMENKFLETITTEEIADYDLSWFKGEIAVVDNIEIFNKVMPCLENEKILGFDTETKPSFRKGHRNNVSLIQLATGNFACLFRVNKIGMPGRLASLLSNPGIVKAGVAIHDDIRFLKTLKRFNPAGFIDLQNFAKEFGIKSSSLKKLTAIILGFRISKGQQVTDWNAGELTDAQKIYAATDAWVCLEIYKKLVNHKEIHR